MDFGMPTLLELDSLEETGALCKELGLSFIELNMNLPQFGLEKLRQTQALLEVKEKYGIYFTVHLDENLNVWDFNPAVASAYLDTVLGTVEVAGRIGAPILNLHLNHGVYFTLPEGKAYLFEKYRAHYENAWRRFCRACEDGASGGSLQICIENTDGFRDFEQKALAAALNSPVFGLTWDIGHSHGVGNLDEPFLMEHVEKLRHFHIHDGLGRKNHMTLGTGEIDLQQRLSIAQRQNCRCVIETKTVDALRKSVSWLQLNFGRLI